MEKRLRRGHLPKSRIIKKCNLLTLGERQLLEINGLSSGYGKIEVLHQINLHVDEGEVVSVLGANGAGKTTLMRTIINLIHARSGTIKYRGKDITHLKTHQIHALGIGIVPEGKRLFEKMTVMENLRMGCFLEKNERVIAERIEKAFDMFPRLKERKDQLSGTMSGGEQAMLTIARGTMSDPDLLIMDEPSFGLAPVLINEMFSIIKRISQEGKTVLLVEQNAWKGLEISDRGYLLQKGEVILEGKSSELKENSLVKKAYFSN
ncbi:ABC transporter ATP-binding protein [Sporolactobacillus sp. THM7-7]|nr:ABC transporter ATP-binding protein [Sporolactobacillus sp. THM7-7]